MQKQNKQNKNKNNAVDFTVRLILVLKMIKKNLMHSILLLDGISSQSPHCLEVFTLTLFTHVIYVGGTLTKPVVISKKQEKE